MTEKTLFEKLQIRNKHENFAKHYKLVKSHTVHKGQVVKVNSYIEGVKKVKKTFYLATKTFNYFLEERNSYDEYFSYGNELDKFKGSALKLLKEIVPHDRVIDLHMHSYGIFGGRV